MRGHRLLALALAFCLPVTGARADSFAPPPMSAAQIATALCQISGPPPAGNTVTASTAGANNEVIFATACVTPAMGVPVTLKCEAWGVVSVGATVPTLRGRVFVNGTAVLDTGAIPGLVTSTNYGWHALYSIAIYTVGASGSLDAQGELRAQIGTTSDLVIPVRNVSAFTMDTTGPISVTLGATWGNALAGSAITYRQGWCK